MIEILEKEGLVIRTGGRGARYAPSTDLDAAALKRYALSEAHPMDAIIGSRLLVLLSISTFPKSIDRIAKETKLKRSTVRVLVWNLKSYGVIVQEGSRIGVSPTAAFMAQFLQDYSKGSGMRSMERKTKFGIMLWSGGLEFIFSSPPLEDLDGVRRTGVSAMADHGLDLITDVNYYHCAYWQPELKVEDIALHNLLISPHSARGIGYSILLLRKAGFNKQYLSQEARCLGIAKLVRQVLELLNGREVDDPLLPSRSDLDDLYAQYGVS